jgi:phosphatidate cytidylyltransferase
MKRLVTAAIGIPLALLVVFGLSDLWFLVVVAAFLGIASYEYLKIVRPHAPHAPLNVLLLAVPAVAFVLSYGLIEETSPEAVKLHLLFGGALLSIGLGTLVLVARTPLAECLPAFGILAFGLPYFAVPIASLYHLHRIDPWLVVLTVGLVSFGDTAAFYVGSRLGKHKMAPLVSPKKSWEGSIAGLLGAVAWGAAWSAYRLGRVDGALLGLVALVAVAGQIGDLVESMIKRGTGVKDSGTVLPGHGGVLDRMDATLFAAPVMLACIRLLELSLAP